MKKMNELHQYVKNSLKKALNQLPIEYKNALNDKTILATGCTGFFGIWTIAAIQVLNEEGLNVRLKVLSTDPQRFQKEQPFWSQTPQLSWMMPEELPEKKTQEAIHLVLHMASSSNAHQNAQHPEKLVEGMLTSTQQVLDICQHHGAELLMVSSGAVYGPRWAPDQPIREEEDNRAPSTLSVPHIYGQTKRMVEAWVAVSKVPFTISRPFAFMGPYLPLDTHFAAGNVLRAAVYDPVIQLQGDGSPLRSWMHPADLVIWQLGLLAKGPRGKAFNIGASEGISIGDWAQHVAQEVQKEVRFGSSPSGKSPHWYVPDISSIKALGFKESWGLNDLTQECLDLLKRLGQWSA